MMITRMDKVKAKLVEHYVNLEYAHLFQWRDEIGECLGLVFGKGDFGRDALNAALTLEKSKRRLQQ